MYDYEESVYCTHLHTAHGHGSQSSYATLIVTLRPPFNKKLLLVDRPRGFKVWTETSFCSCFLRVYNKRVYKSNKRQPFY